MDLFNESFTWHGSLHGEISPSVFMVGLMRSGGSRKDRMGQRAGAQSGKRGHQQGLTDHIPLHLLVLGSKDASVSR